MTHKPCSILRLALFAIAMLTGGQVACAQDLPHEAEAAPRVAVDLGGVDLTTPEGLALARHRINGAARAVCGSVVDLDGWHLQKSACVLLARKGASRQLAQMRDLAQARRRGKTVDYAVKTADASIAMDSFVRDIKAD